MSQDEGRVVVQNVRQEDNKIRTNGKMEYFYPLRAGQTLAACGSGADHA